MIMFITLLEKVLNIKHNEALHKYGIPSEMTAFNYLPIKYWFLVVQLIDFSSPVYFPFRNFGSVGFHTVEYFVQFPSIFLGF